MGLSREVLHPLAGRACPTLGDLLARADYDATPVLEAATRLAHHRFHQQDRARELQADIVRQPWECSPLTWELPPRVLMPADVARALVAVAPTEVVANLFTNLDCNREQLDQATAHWRAVLTNSGHEGTSDMPLLRPWARRYSWWFTHGSDPITLAELMGNCVYKQFSKFVGIYHEGLITLEEAQNALLRELMQSTPDSARVEVDLPAAYFNRGGYLAELEDKLAEGPGAVLVGDPGSGRSALLRACRLRHRRGDGPAAIQGFGFNVDRVYELPNYVDGKLRVPPEVDTRCVFALVHMGVSELLAGHQAWHESIEYALKMSGSGHALRVVVGVTRTEYQKLLARIPGCGALPVIEIPNPSGLDRVMFWMCRVFELEQAARGPISLAQILWWLSRWPAHDGALPGCDGLTSPAPRGFVRAIARVRQNPSKQPAGRLRRVLDRLRLDGEDLQFLVETEDRLFAGDR